jgi:hypothetical protein
VSDKVKRAARKRQAETGEPYTVARRMVIAEYEAVPPAFLDEHDEAVVGLFEEDE